MMKTIRTSFKKNMSLFLFISILFLFGVITGILFYFKQDLSIRQTIISSLTGLFQNNVFELKNIFYHLLIFIIICALLFCFLGIPMLVIYIFFEGLSIGFILPIFVSLFKINAIGYFLVYFLLIKFVYIFLLFFLFAKTFHFTKTYLLCLKNKNYVFMNELKYIVFLIVFILLNDFVIYFVSNRILILLLGGN